MSGRGHSTIIWMAGSRSSTTSPTMAQPPSSGKLRRRARAWLTMRWPRRRPRSERLERSRGMERPARRDWRSWPEAPRSNWRRSEPSWPPPPRPRVPRPQPWPFFGPAHCLLRGPRDFPERLGGLALEVPSPEVLLAGLQLHCLRTSSRVWRMSWSAALPRASVRRCCSSARSCVGSSRPKWLCISKFLVCPVVPSRQGCCHSSCCSSNSSRCSSNSSGRSGSSSRSSSSISSSKRSRCSGTQNLPHLAPPWIPCLPQLRHWAAAVQAWPAVRDGVLYLARAPHRLWGPTWPAAGRLPSTSSTESSAGWRRIVPLVPTSQLM
mmetsp:Transcript_74494/g.193971  ORF Transcript_74494/g.193971 Transcript_74494/m.193971 type:complete len:322 (+) Transcript_74494:171-1136(+)